MSNVYSESPPFNRPLTTQQMQLSPPRDDARQNPGYPAAASSLPFSSPLSPYDRNVYMQYPRQSTIPGPYPYSYRPPNIPTAVQNPGSFQLTEPATEGPPVNVPFPHANPPYRFSQPFIPNSTGSFPFMNYPPYPPSEGGFPSPLMFTPYSATPYHQLQSPEYDRQASWSYHATQHSDVTAGFQSNYPAPYPNYPQIDTHPTSAPSPPGTHSPKPQRPASPERRLDVAPGRSDKWPLVRRSYHPNPPAYRLQWVMWVGNIPADATHDELWRFFTKFSEDDPDVVAQSGVKSIFLISRSSCAFVNYEAEIDLNAALKHFNGHPLRPGDPRCPNLVCRIRRTDDDLKAGVGGQRGMGMHIRWVKERKAEGQGAASSQASSDTVPEISISDSENPNASMLQSSSTTSTTSSLLSRFFPQRYFILKSSSQVIFWFYCFLRHHLMVYLV